MNAAYRPATQRHREANSKNTLGRTRGWTYSDTACRRVGVGTGGAENVSKEEDTRQHEDASKHERARKRRH